MNLTIVSEFKSDWRSYLSEFLGTFVFIFLTTLLLISSATFKEINELAIATVVGFSYAAMVFATANTGGGYLNPTVTLSLWLTQRFSAFRAFMLVFAQICASIFASLVLFWIFGLETFHSAVSSVEVGVGVNGQTALLVEAVISAVLVFVVFATMIDRRGPVSFGPWVLGLVLIAATIVALPVTGAVFNPARIVGPAVVGGNYGGVFVWLLGPLMGSLFGAFYDFVFIRKSKKR